MTELPVDHETPAVAEMAQECAVIDALMGGTKTMRLAGTALLPKWPSEEQAHFDTRLSVATLYPSYERTMSVMSSKPFAKPLTLSKDTPTEILNWSEDIDLEGVNLHTFAAEMFGVAISWGMAGILVESPKALPPANGRVVTVAEQKAAGVRPYFVRVLPNQFLGWRIRKVGNIRQLTQLRLRESAEVDAGNWGSRVVERVRVLEPGNWKLYEKQVTNSGFVWVLGDEGLTGINFIPFVPLYGKRKGFMCGKAPLMNLAYQNVKHWQSQSDQDTILHVARVPILFAKGFPSDTVIAIGSSTAINLSEATEHADLKFVEHTGKSIEAGQKSLDSLQQQMVEAGAELLVSRPGKRTATEDSNDEEGNRCDLQRSGEGFEDSVDLALRYAAIIASLQKSGNVTLYKDYAAASLSDASAKLVLDLQMAGLLSKPTVLREQQRRGVISSDIDPEAEIAAAALEGPAPGDETGGV